MRGRKGGRMEVRCVRSVPDMSQLVTNNTSMITPNIWFISPKLGTIFHNLATWTDILHNFTKVPKHISNSRFFVLGRYVYTLYIDLYFTFTWLHIMMNLSADKKYIRSYSFIHRYFLIQSIKRDIAQKQMSKEIFFYFYWYNTLNILKLINYKLFSQNMYW